MNPSRNECLALEKLPNVHNSHLNSFFFFWSETNTHKAITHLHRTNKSHQSNLEPREVLFESTVFEGIKSIQFVQIHNKQAVLIK